MAGPSVPLMAGLAGSMAAFGLLVWYMERRRGRTRNLGLFLLTGPPGLYLSALTSWGASKWLLVPGLGLLIASYVVQFTGWRNKDAAADTKRRDD